jgi:predicted alpha/beta hydrolase family esterase
MCCCCPAGRTPTPATGKAAGSSYGYQRLEQHDWQRPLRGDWSARLQEHLVDAPAPVVLVAHSLGCMLAAWWAAHSPLARTQVRAPCWWPRATWSSRTCARSCRAGRRCCCRPCPSLDAGGQQQRPVLRPGARAAVGPGLGQPWVDAGPAGHINTASGLGDWDAGRALLEQLMKDN